MSFVRNYEAMNKTSKTLSIFLGASMFAFGTLKFINPFKNWYTVQVQQSELPFEQFSYWSGQVGEILVGMLFLFLVYRGKQVAKYSMWFFLANFLTISMMIVAIYVHMHPGVPNDVLPLKIKPPVIPLFFIGLPLLNLFMSRKDLNLEEFKNGMSF